MTSRVAFDSNQVDVATVVSMATIGLARLLPTVEP
jgi:hypothetical protein